MTKGHKILPQSVPKGRRPPLNVCSRFNVDLGGFRFSYPVVDGVLQFLEIRLRAVQPVNEPFLGREIGRCLNDLLPNWPNRRFNILQGSLSVP